jgi:hypothetical protein
MKLIISPQKSIKTRHYFIIVASVLAISILSFFTIKLFDINLFSNANDSDYYHAYAVGQISGNAVNIWATFLRLLFSCGFYSRHVVSTLLYLQILLIALFVPRLLVFTSNIGKQSYAVGQLIKKIRFAFALLVLISPTYFMLSLDLYRDIMMLTIFFLNCFIVENYISNAGVIRFLLLIIFIINSFILFLFRPYLGLSMIISFFLSALRFRSSLWGLLIIANFVLLCFFLFGIVDQILIYRSTFLDSPASTNLGIDLSSANLFTFNILFLYSAFLQLFGFQISSPLSLLFFMFETLPFIYCLYYSAKFSLYTDKFERYLLLFFLVYTSIWVLGNDNLGTAFRLRIPSYFSIYILYFRYVCRKLTSTSFSIYL